MSEKSIEKLQKQLKVYKVVFLILIVLTIVGSYLSQHITGTKARLVLILCIAVVQGVLSASYFMHLNAEKKSITWFLILTGFFFLTLLLLPILTHLDAVKF